MTATFKHGLFASLTAISAVVAPFLLGAAGLVFGLGVYRIFAPGPRGQESGWDAAWGVIVPAWPLFIVALLFTVAGLYGFKKSSALSRETSEQSRNM